MPVVNQDTTLPQLSERDLQPVKDLIEEARRLEISEQLGFATQTWLNAFVSFKKARNRYGLPQNESAKTFYGMVLADLKATGKALSFCLQQKVLAPENCPITPDNFAACIRELECDDAILEMGFLDGDADLSDVENVLGTV